MQKLNATEKRERPILFNSEMVKKVLDGSKSQTRRVMKPQPEISPFETYFYPNSVHKNFRAYACENHFKRGVWQDFQPFGKVGDLLWVRETFGEVQGFGGDPDAIVYRADNEVRFFDIENRFIPTDEPYFDACLADVWKPSIFMPRAASRITLEVTEIRVERLQDISSDDAIAEGAVCSGDPNDEMGRGNVPKWSMTGETDWRHCLDTPVCAFCNLWNKINGKRENCKWSDNPFVWVISFRKL